MGFLYYIPGQSTVNAAVLAATGLTGRLRSHAQRQVTGGPGATDGVLVADADDSIRYEPTIQEWVDRGKFWIGWWKDRIPGPVDFEKDETVIGTPVDLGDGNQWVFPTVLGVDGETTLPVDFVVNASGDYEEVIGKQYAAVQDAAALLLAQWQGAGELSNRDFFYACLEALQVNYNIGADEVSILRLFNQRVYAYILAVVIDAANREL